MQNDNTYPPRGPAGEKPRKDPLGPAKGIVNGLAISVFVGLLLLVAGVAGSALVWAIASIWGAIL